MRTDEENIDAVSNVATVRRQPLIRRVWAMPSKHTFTIKPINELLQKYVGDGKGWIDPFAGENSPAEWTNDLNESKPTRYHLHAREFVAQMTGEFTGVLFDPPYSLRQTKECYDGIGVKMSADDTRRFPENIKDELAPKIKISGLALSFGWNTNGFGKNRGFQITEILIVAHGGRHNDTIVTVERKTAHQERMPL